MVLAVCPTGLLGGERRHLLVLLLTLRSNLVAGQMIVAGLFLGQTLLNRV